MFTIKFWKAELAKFDELFEECSEDEDQIDRLARGITYLGAQVAQQNPESKREIVDAVVQRLMAVEDRMGREWFLSRIVEITAHALPT
tara:strand:- start:17334 stop:17597 length:264 start_codon:yes stop_codon:yes gene_type:complete